MLMLRLYSEPAGLLVATDAPWTYSMWPEGPASAGRLRAYRSLAHPPSFFSALGKRVRPKGLLLGTHAPLVATDAPWDLLHVA